MNKSRPSIRNQSIPSIMKRMLGTQFEVKDPDEVDNPAFDWQDLNAQHHSRVDNYSPTVNNRQWNDWNWDLQYPTYPLRPSGSGTISTTISNLSAATYSFTNTYYFTNGTGNTTTSTNNGVRWNPLGLRGV